MPPGGEPIKIGHHCEGRHRKAIATAQKAMARAVAAAAEAEAKWRKAEASESAEAHRRNPVTVRNRIERLEVEQRRDERSRDGYRRTMSLADGAVSLADGAVEECQAATGEGRERLLRQIVDRQDQIDYWRRVYETQQAEGIATAYSREMIAKGDAVCYRNRWYEVTRVNAKSVTVKMSRGTGTIRIHRIGGHRPASRTAEQAT